MFMSNEDLKQCMCGFCGCYANVPPIRLIDGKVTCGRCSGEGLAMPMIEIMAKKMIFPCRYSNFGCTRTFQWNQALQHENECLYKSINCANCLWVGATCNLRAHFTKEHSKLVMGPGQNISINMKQREELNLLYVDSDSTYIVSLNAGPNGIIHCVRAFCKDSELNYHSYDISVSQSVADFHWRKQKLLSFEDRVYSINRIISMACLESTFNMVDFLAVAIHISSTNKSGGHAASPDAVRNDELFNDTYPVYTAPPQQSAHGTCNPTGVTDVGLFGKLAADIHNTARTGQRTVHSLSSNIGIERATQNLTRQFKKVL